MNEEIPIPATTMILGGSVLLANIMTGETEDHVIEDVNKKKVILLSDSTGQIVDREYTAQAVCDSQPFRAFVKATAGENISMTFEGMAYYGYITKWEIDDHERTIHFSFTTISSFVLPPDDERFLSL